MKLIFPDIPEAWRTEETEKAYRAVLPALEKEYGEHTCYPKAENLFRALELTSPESVCAVILGQDPYHEPDQACGLAFSVPSGTRTPPSLRNILAELNAEKGTARTETDLSDWARNGVLLLNTSLSVREHEAGSHAHIGWDRFVAEILNIVASQDRRIVWLLWGAPAGKYRSVPCREGHLVLTSAHPSPLSAYRGFLGNGHFLKAEKHIGRVIF